MVRLAHGLTSSGWTKSRTTTAAPTMNEPPSSTIHHALAEFHSRSPRFRPLSRIAATATITNRPARRPADRHPSDLPAADPHADPSWRRRRRWAFVLTTPSCWHMPASRGISRVELRSGRYRWSESWDRPGSAQAVLVRVRGSGGPGRYINLGEDVAEMPRDGALTEHKRGRDLSVALAGSDEA